jgi:hypothetical protein
VGVVVSPLGPPLVYGARCGSRGSGSIPEGDETNVDTDLIPLCSNCHRMVHRRKGKLLSLEELSSMLNQNNSDE